MENSWYECWNNLWKHIFSQKNCYRNEDSLGSDDISRQVETGNCAQNDQFARRPEGAHHQRLPDRPLAHFRDLLSTCIPNSDFTTNIEIKEIIFIIWGIKWQKSTPSATKISTLETQYFAKEVHSGATEILSHKRKFRL